MSNDQDRRSDIQNRRINVRVFGDTVDELELAALDEARAFFGADARLEIERTYQANHIDPRGMLAAEADGKRYVATMMVHVRD